MAIDPRLPRPIEDRNKPYDGDWARLLRRLDELFRDNDNQHEKKVGKYAETVGDGVSVSFDLTHNLNTTDICGVFAYDIATGVQITRVSATVISANVLRVTFLVVVAANSTRVIVSA
jgi:hypothetical protein